MGSTYVKRKEAGCNVFLQGVFHPKERKNLSPVVTYREVRSEQVLSELRSQFQLAASRVAQ